MEIQTFIEETSKKIIPIAELTTLAADRRSFGDDVIAAFTSQIQQRSTQAQTVLDTATAANRDTLLASEQRSYDANIRERDSILSLLHSVERRTEARGHVPASQTTIETRTTETADLGPVLSKEQRCSEYISKRGNARYAGERGALRFGAVIRALALGDRRGLSDLEMRALSEGSDAAGGFTVPEILSAQFIDRVRNAAVVFRAGAVTVPMTSDTLHLARLAQPGLETSGSPSMPAAQGAWKVENAAIAESSLTLERVTFTARTLPMLIKLSVELSEDSSNIDAIIEKEMSMAMALELDRAALLGSGTPPEPRGIINVSGVDVSALNAAIDYDALIDAAAVVASANHRANARVYNADAAKVLAKLRAAPTGVYLEPPAYLDPVTEYVTNQIASDGGSPDTSSFVVGDFTQLMIGLRTSFRLEVSRVAADATSSAFTNLQVWIRAYLRADVQLAHPEAFAVRTAVTVG